VFINFTRYRDRYRVFTSLWDTPCVQDLVPGIDDRGLAIRMASASVWWAVSFGWSSGLIGFIDIDRDDLLHYCSHHRRVLGIADCYARASSTDVVSTWSAIVLRTIWTC